MANVSCSLLQLARTISLQRGHSFPASDISRRAPKGSVSKLVRGGYIKRISPKSKHYEITTKGARAAVACKR